MSKESIDETKLRKKILAEIEKENKEKEKKLLLEQEKKAELVKQMDQIRLETEKKVQQDFVKTLDENNKKLKQSYEKKEEKLKAEFEDKYNNVRKETYDELAPVLSSIPVLPKKIKGRKKDLVTTAVLLVNDGQASLTPCVVKDSEFITVGDEKKGTYKEIFYHVNPTLLVIDRSLFPGLIGKQKGYYYIVTFFAKQYEPITRNLNTGAPLGAIANQPKKINKLLERGVLIQYKKNPWDEHPTSEWTRTFKNTIPPNGKNYRVSPEYTDFEIYDVSDIDAINAEVKHAQDTKQDQHLMTAMNEEMEIDPNKDLKMVLLGALIGFISYNIILFLFISDIIKAIAPKVLVNETATMLLTKLFGGF